MGGGRAVVISEEVPQDELSADRGVAALAAPIVTTPGFVEAVMAMTMPVPRPAELGQEEVGSRIAAACRRISNGLA
jgi:DNA-binding IclR family transcriptional regulator